MSWYLAGFPKKSTLNSMKPSAVSCLTTQSVVHSEVSLIASASSELLRPSLLFPMTARADYFAFAESFLFFAQYSFILGACFLLAVVKVRPKTSLTAILG